MRTYWASDCGEKSSGGQDRDCANIAGIFTAGTQDASTSVLDPVDEKPTPRPPAPTVGTGRD